MNIKPQDDLTQIALSTDVSLWGAPKGATWEPQREPQTKVRQPELEALLTKRQLNVGKIGILS